MPQLLNLGPSFGEQLGTALGTGFSGGLQERLQSLAKERVDSLQRKKQATGLEALGMSPEQAQSLSGLDPQILREVIKQQQQAPQQQAYAQALSQLLGGEQQSPEAFSMPQGLTQQQATELTKIGMKKQASDQQQRSAVFKETKETRKDITDAAKASRDNNARLSRMEKLISEGKLQNPFLYSTLKKVGLDISALQNPESQEFEKLTNDFLKNAKSIFGSRVSNFEIEQFLKTVPSLAQSDDGKERIIRNLKLLNEGNLLREQTMREVIKENKGVPTYDLNEKIEERIGPKLDEITERFVDEGGDKNIDMVDETALNLPKAALYQENTLIKVGDKKYRVKGINWVEE